LALRITDDELAHSEFSHATYAAAGGRAALSLPSAGLGLHVPPGEPLVRSVARAVVEGFCLGETVAVRLFRRLREGCDEPSARAALDRILADEVRHRDFGWTALEWLLGSPCEAAARGLMTAELGAMFRRQKAAYAFARRGEPESRTEVERRWGMMPPTHYARALGETLKRDYVPRFAELDIDARAAFGE
jgi:hypothetical protein